MVGKEGWPMRGRDLVMWSEGQWDASKKNALDGADISTDGHGDSMTNSAQWGRVGEKTSLLIAMLQFQEQGLVCWATPQFNISFTWCKLNIKCRQFMQPGGLVILLIWAGGLTHNSHSAALLSKPTHWILTEFLFGTQAHSESWKHSTINHLFSVTFFSQHVRSHWPWSQSCFSQRTRT